MIARLSIPSYERFVIGDSRVVAAKDCSASIREVLEKLLRSERISTSNPARRFSR